MTESRFRTVHNPAIAWLDAWLQDRGVVPSAEVKAAGVEAGFSLTQLQRAARTLGIVVVNRPTMPRTTTWGRPDGAD